MDVKTGNCFSTTSKNVGLERDFNRIDIDGQPIDALETTLASFESEAIHAIRRVLTNLTFPEAEDLNLVLNLVGLIAVRNPRARNTFNHARKRSLEMIADILVSDRRIFESHMRKATRDGYISNADVSFEELKKFIENGSYTIDFHPQGNSSIEFEAFDKLLPTLAQRFWSIFLTTNSGSEFISSDHPVTLIHKDGNEGPVGFGLKQTEVFIPLGPTVGLYGTFEDPLPAVVNVTHKEVAEINARLVASAERYVFSRLKSFSIWYEGNVREVECD